MTESRTEALARCEVLIVGGGPAGSTLAALLRERGRDVVLLEKARHPRFHIGESLLPLNLPLFDKLGIHDEVRAIGMPKHGAEFVSPWHPKPVTFDFGGAVAKDFPFAYQVRRSDFDEILFRNAERKGGTTFEDCRVTKVDFNDDGALVTARHADGREQQWQTRFLVDATGRDTLLANQLQLKQRNPKHSSAAIFGHFEGATRLPGREEGNISLFWFDHGWFWFIPLSDGATSVGAVCWPYYMKTRKTDPEQFFFDTIAMAPALAERLAGAKLVSEVTATGNYSYSAERAAGRNYLMLGDAYTFIDPVLSTGVLFAMQGAFIAVETIEKCLDKPPHAASALKAFDSAMRYGPRVFSWFIYRMTSPSLRDLFMNPALPRVQAGVLSVLAGDIFRGTPLGSRLAHFKLVYYLHSLFNLKRSIRAWKSRKNAIRAVPA